MWETNSLERCSRSPPRSRFHTLEIMDQVRARGLTIRIISNARRTRTLSATSYLLDQTLPRRVQATLLVEERASEAPCSRPGHPTRKRSVPSTRSICNKVLTSPVNCFARKPETGGSTSFQPRKVKKTSTNTSYRDRAAERRIGAEHEFTHVSFYL